MQRLPITDPPDPAQVAAVADALRAGRLAILPTETVYGFAADADHAGAVADLLAVKGRPAGQPFTFHLGSADELSRVAAPPPKRVQALLDRVWPGPLTAILPGRTGAEVGVRVPAHPFTAAVLSRFASGVFMTSVNRSGAPPLTDPAVIAAEYGRDARIALLADAGPPRLGEPSAIVRLRGRRLEIVRPGLLDAGELLTAAAAKVLFVCTGNTCRSPLAEALARKVVGAELAVEPDEVLAHGLWFHSAGTGTLPGMPASAAAAEAAQEVGLDLTGHRSRSLTAERLEQMDRIFCLSSSHLKAVLATHPTAAPKTSLLDPDGRSVPDPFGGRIEVYRQTRDEIERLLRARLPELLALGQ